MDRRDFLKTTGAAAVAGGTASAAAAGDAAPVAAPAVLSGIRELTLASDRAFPPGEGADRLARRIEAATGNRYRVTIAHDGDADLSYGGVWRHAGLHRAFHVFAGLPFAQGLEASAHQTWLAVGGGSMLWEELAAGLGHRPLVVGHTGPNAGVWASARLELPSDLAGARVHVEGLAADALRTLGVAPTTLDAADLGAALAAGRLQAAEWLGPIAAAAPDLRPLAQRVYSPGFNRHGMLLSLDVSRRLWDGMTSADRAILEGCAAHEHQLSLADAAAHALIARQVVSPSKWPARLAWSSEVGGALERAAAEAVAAIADIDPQARRIHDSYQAFRRMLGDPATA
jgi:TRAP-type mannitol/chloroaromatic compound transport system substrate-binding protein